MMIDYWPDNQIDCKDFAIYNSKKAEQEGATNIKWIITKEKNHVFVVYEKDGYFYVADNDRLYSSRIPDSLR